MLLIQILVIISALIALAAGIPQMIQLIKTKNSDEFSLSTWALWIVTQSVSTVYAISIGDKLLMSINLAWVLFYIVMVGLIIKYAQRGTAQPIALQPQEISPSDSK